MSTSEPPEPERSGAGQPPGEQHPESAHPTVPMSSEHSAAPGGTETTPSSSTPPEPATAASRTSASAASGSAPPAGVGGSRWRPARRWPWIAGGVAALLVALLVGAAIGFAAGHHRPGEFRGWHGRHHAQGAYPDMAHGPGWPGRMGRGGPEGPGGPGGGRAGAGTGGPGATPALIGAVSSVNGPTLVVAQDGGAPVSVTTTDRTRVVGDQLHAVTDLKPGQRIVVRLAPDRSATGVLAMPATARGTITTLNGTQATLTQIDGLTLPVDTSGLATQPKAGDLVAVWGAAANNGTMLKANSLRELPKAQ